MKIVIIITFCLLIIQNSALADAKTELNKIINPDADLTVEKTNTWKSRSNNVDKKQQVRKNNNSLPLTNYQYDEANYHYYKYKKYVLDNENYAQSGKMKY